MPGRFRVLVLLAALLAAPARSADDPPQTPTAPAPAPDPSATLHGKLQLSIQDAIAMGLRNNLDVEVSRFDPLLVYEELQAAWGVYDPELFADARYESRETPVASSLQVNSLLVEREIVGESGLRGKIPALNATYEVGYRGDRLETNSSISELSPQYVSGLRALIQVPLLKDLFWDADWTRVKQTRALYDIQEEEFRRQVMDTVRNIETAYWSLVAAEEALRVAEKSVEAARALLDQTETQYEVGVVSRVEVTEAEAGLAQREVSLIVSQNEYRTSQDVLMNEVLGRGLRPGSRLEIVPADRPQDYVVYEIDVEEAARKAFTNRPELAAAKREIDRRALEAKYRNNQRLPTLDAVASYGVTGLSGGDNPDNIDFGAGTRATLNAVNQGVIAPLNAGGIPLIPLPVPPPPGPPLVGRSYSDSDDEWFKRDGAQSWTAGGIFSIPLFNRTARHLASRAEIDLRKSHSELARLEQGIILSVRLAARNLESAQEGIGAAERARVAADEQLRAEKIRLEQGESTPFDVLLREENLVQAESSLINAIRVYRNSIVALDREQGTILETRNIVIDEVKTLR